MNQEVVNNWIEGLKATLEGYALEDVFNWDETGLFWKGLPNRTLVVQEDKSKGGKLAKECVTVLLCCSASGEKLKPLLIGRSQMPRCFNGKLPVNVIWKANKKAWMLTSLFKEWLQNNNSDFEWQGRKILLLLDNAPVHPDIYLSHVQLYFLPANTTAGTAS